jgi:hypothetical protein
MAAGVAADHGQQRRYSQGEYFYSSSLRDGM